MTEKLTFTVFVECLCRTNTDLEANSFNTELYVVLSCVQFLVKARFLKASMYSFSDWQTYECPFTDNACMQFHRFLGPGQRCMSLKNETD